MSDGLHISSLLLRADPKTLPHIKEAIEAREGADVVVADESGKIIVTLESENESEIVECLNDFSLLDGVVSSALVYHEVVET